MSVPSRARGCGQVGGGTDGQGGVQPASRSLNDGQGIRTPWAMTNLLRRPAPFGPFRARALRASIPGMQVLASPRAKAGQPSRFAFYTALLAGTICTAVGIALLYLVFGGAFMTRFMPAGRPSTYDLVVGALAWTFALTAPAGFGLIGLARLATAYERWRARRPRITPAVKLRRAIGDDHVVATSVRLPVGNRMVPELIVGPFGVAVIEELPPPGAVMSRGVRTWEVRVGNGYIRTIENPLDRAGHDADVVRAWLSPEDADHVVKVYAAVVGSDDRVERTASTAYIRPSQVAEWLASLPPQKSFDAGRRDRIVREIRSAL
jgi:hypothetical protein